MDIFSGLIGLYVFFGVVNIIVNGDVLYDATFSQRIWFGLAWPLFAFLWLMSKLGFRIR